MQEFAADTAVEADAAGDVMHIGANFFAQIGHFVDKRHFHRKERVARVFGQLRRFDAGIQDRCLNQVQRPVQPSEHIAGAVGFRADHDAIGPHEVGDGIAFTQKLGVRRDVDIQIRPGGADDFLDPAAGADGNRRFGHDHHGRR